MKHTPIPWTHGYSNGTGKYSKHKGDYQAYITYDDNNLIATVWDCDQSRCDFDDEAVLMNAHVNAQFIVKAVNNHDKLVEVLREIAGEATNHNAGSDSMYECLEEIERVANKVLEQVEAS